MKKILLSATIYRVGERIYPIIPELSKEYNLDVYRHAQMSDKLKWYGDNDCRLMFDTKYMDYVDNIYHDLPTLNNYDLVLFDDCRPRNSLKEISFEARKKNIVTLSNYEGNGYFELNNLNRDIQHWDKLFLFGKKDVDKHIKTNIGTEDNFLSGGIPANDKLSKYETTEKHILVIVNFLGNRSCPFNIQVDKNFIDKTGLLELQKEFNREIIFKIKSRKDHPYPKKDIEYIKNITPDELNYRVVIDCEDDNKLISDSLMVISSPSTLAFKSIQKGIPTILIKESGIDGTFSDFSGLVELDTQQIFDEIERQYDKGRDKDFIRNTIEGGLNYNSTEIYINKIRRILNEC